MKKYHGGDHNLQILSYPHCSKWHTTLYPGYQSTLTLKLVDLLTEHTPLLTFGSAVLVLSGAGPHPKAMSGRIVSAIWWLFALLLLASYFANFNIMIRSSSKHTSIKSFEDLANQNVIDYGTVEGGATMMFFKAHSVAPNFGPSTRKSSAYWMTKLKCSIFRSFPEFQQPCLPAHLSAHGA